MGEIESLRLRIADLEQLVRADSPETHWHSVFDNMFEGVQIVDDQWRYIYLNEAAARHGRKPREELLGCRMDEQYPGLKESAMFQMLRRCMSERTQQQMVNRFSYADGQTAWFDLRVTPVPMGILILSVDITRQKEMEAQLLATEASKKEFCRDLIQAVTGGKFRLVEPEEIPALPENATELPLDGADGYKQLRQCLRELGQESVLSEECVEDFVLAVGEAAGNATKHGRGGVAKVCLVEDGIAVRVQDQGPGMSAADFPRTLFGKGFSTVDSLGLGYSLILSLTDAVWLAPEPAGTVVQLHKRRAGLSDEDEVRKLLERYT